MKDCNFSYIYDSPVGKLILQASPNKKLCGINFEEHKNGPPDLKSCLLDNSTRQTESKQALSETIECLDLYFDTGKVDCLPEYELEGTEFQIDVWEALTKIKSGTTTTYGDLARQLGREKANRAVGAAVGKNPISILIPCHRVLGANQDLTGFAGGLNRKAWLLNHETTYSLDLFRAKNSTILK